MVKWASVFLAVTLLVAVNAHSIDKSEYDCINLDFDNDFRMYWKILDDTDELEVLLEAKTTGYLAMGLSLDGTMPSGSEGADITMGWVDDSSAIPNIYDYHSTARAIPDLDDAQNVTLLLGEQEDGYTKFLFRRPMSRGSDDQDRNWLPSETSRVIWAVHPDDPASPTVWNKHSAKGTISFRLDEASECINPDELNYFTSPDGRYTLTWGILGNFASFSMKAVTNGWVAMGLSPSGAMSDADMVVGWVDQDDQVVLTDRYSSGYVMPGMDDSQDVYDVEGSEGNLETTISWRRPLQTGDADDVGLIPEEISLLWAYGIADGNGDMNFDAHSSRGVATINLFSGAATGLSDPRLVHGLLMLVAWPMCSAGGLIVARYLKASSDRWFKLHVGLQMSTIILTLVSMFVVLSSFNFEFRPSPHAFAGVFVVAGSVAQGFIGAWSHKAYDPKRSAAPVVPDRLHWWLGRAVVLVSYATVWFGLKTWGASPVVFYALGAVMLYTAAVAVYFEATGAAKGREHAPVETDSVAPESKAAEEKGAAAAGGRRELSSGGTITWSVLGAVLFGVVGMAAYFALFPPSLRNSSDGPADWCPDCEIVDLTWPNYPVSLNSTSYACTSWSYAIPEGKHVVRIDPIVLDEDEPYYHHAVLGVMGSYDGGLINHDCPMPQGQMISAWAVGAGPLVMPDIAGIRVGVPGSSTTFTMQVHLDNAGATPGVTLNSGMRVYIAPEMREKDVGIAVLGGWANGTTIPPGEVWDPSQNLYGVHGSGWCGLNFTNMHVFSVIEHMHKAGRRQTVYVFDVLETNATYVRAEFVHKLGGNAFSFDDQSFVPVDPPLFIPGPEGDAGDGPGSGNSNLFVTNCEWSTADKIGPTGYGDGSDEEMCFFLMLFYADNVDPLSPQINCGQQMPSASEEHVEYSGGCYDDGSGNVDYFDTLSEFCFHNSSWVPPEEIIWQA